MKSKILNVLLIITSLVGYLEWGGNNQVFLFEAEAEIISKLFTDPVAALHPFTILPLMGQVLLIITLFQKKPNRKLTYISLASLGILLGFMLAIGLLSLNYKIILSTFPFIIVAVMAVSYYRKEKNN